MNLRIIQEEPYLLEIDEDNGEIWINDILILSWNEFDESDKTDDENGFYQTEKFTMNDFV